MSNSFQFNLINGVKQIRTNDPFVNLLITLFIIITIPILIVLGITIVAGFWIWAKVSTLFRTYKTKAAEPTIKVNVNPKKRDLDNAEYVEYEMVD